MQKGKISFILKSVKNEKSDNTFPAEIGTDSAYFWSKLQFFVQCVLVDISNVNWSSQWGE